MLVTLHVMYCDHEPTAPHIVMAIAVVVTMVVLVRRIKAVKADDGATRIAA